MSAEKDALKNKKKRRERERAREKRKKKKISAPPTNNPFPPFPPSVRGGVREVARKGGNHLFSGGVVWVGLGWGGGGGYIAPSLPPPRRSPKNHHKDSLPLSCWLRSRWLTNPNLVAFGFLFI